MGVNDPNAYGIRTELSVVAAAIAGVVGWVGGTEATLWTLAGRTYPPAVLWQVVSEWGLVPSRWGWWGYAPAVTAALAALGVGAGAWRLLTMPSERHVRGFVLHKDPAPVARALRPSKGEAAGVHIHPQVTISQRQECNHFMVVGGTGAGKTTIIWPIMQEAIARGDKVLLFDSKGDYTQRVCEPFTLLSPTDARSSRWTIGRDIRTKLEAMALAGTLIQEQPGGSKADPMWVQGSRALLTGLITDLQTRFGEKWDFSHLAYESAATLADYERLKAVIAREAPICLALLGGEDAVAPSRTTMGFLMQIISSLTNVIHIGVAAHDHKANPGWSVRGWLAGKTPNVVVIGFRGEQSEHLSQVFASSIIERIVRQISGFSDSAPERRRIWLCVDETPVAGYVPSLTVALTTLRSKGTRIVTGFQTQAGVREKYSKDTAQIWEGQCDVKIVGKLTATADQEWASQLLGEREIERYSHTTSQQSHSDQGGQHSAAWQRVREPVLLPASFGQELGMQKDRRGHLKGPRALMLAGGQAALIDWPLTPRIALREPVVDARWIQPGYHPPAWGQDPPVVAPQLAGSLSKTGKQKQAHKKKPVQEQQTATVTVTKQDPDLPPLLPGQQPEPQETPVDRLAGGVLEHVLDAAAPGAALAARILGLVSDTATATGRPTQQTVTVTKRQWQEAEAEHEPDENDRDE